MITSIKLPEIGEGVTEGELVKWLVKVGDIVKVDQSIAEVMTDKATVEVPTTTSGIVKALKAKEGDVIKVEQVMIELESASSATEKGSMIESKNGNTSTNEKAIQLNQVQMTQSTSNAVIRDAAAGASVYANKTSHELGVNSINQHKWVPPADSRVLATPATRRLAREMSIDINQLQGTGLAGRVTREDILQFQGTGATVSNSLSITSTNKLSTIAIPRLSYQSTTGANEERIALKGIRKKIAENMQLAKHIVPHFTLMDEVNVSQLVLFRENLKSLAEKEGTKITYLPFVMKALISTIRNFPQFNASIDDAAQEIVYKKYFNLGFAADTPNGLVVPVIKNADQKTILELSKEIIELSKRARDGKLKPDEMKGATITITNIGSVGGTYATPIINHPEVAILGMYKIQDKVIVDNGEFKAIKAMNFTITADHRLIDGAVAANFLKAFFQRIEQPAVLMADMI